MHGLNGHREDTWTYEDHNTKKKTLWLREILPSKIPTARIWTWGYDSRTYSQSHREPLTIKKLYDHGRELVSDIDLERRDDGTEKRPIIFITHGLGGIVVKTVSSTYPLFRYSRISNLKVKALLHSDHVRPGHLEKERSVKLSTYGIIFLGCPHQGAPDARTAALLNNLAKIRGCTNDNLLKHLDEHSEYLERQKFGICGYRSRL